MTAAVEIARCPWPGIADPEYARYHDEEWGVPLTDDRLLFEKLVLEGFQSGLSWLTILKKRENFRRAFDHFDTKKIACYGEREIGRLMTDAGIVRNKLKIEWPIVEETLASATEFCDVVPLTLEGHVRAVEISKTHLVSIYDANIIAAAELAGCDTLYTEDLNHGQRIGSVTIRNPFMAEA